MTDQVHQILDFWVHGIIQKRGFSNFAIFYHSFKFASNLLKIQNPKFWIPDPSLQRSREKKVGQSIEHFLRFSWLSMQFQIAKVFPASLHFSVRKKTFGVFFSYLLEERPNFFPWLLSRPCSNTSNNIAESMIWSKLISKHFFLYLVFVAQMLTYHFFALIYISNNAGWTRK